MCLVIIPSVSSVSSVFPFIPLSRSPLFLRSRDSISFGWQVIDLHFALVFDIFSVRLLRWIWRHVSRKYAGPDLSRRTDRGGRARPGTRPNDRLVSRSWRSRWSRCQRHQHYRRSQLLLRAGLSDRKRIARSTRNQFQQPKEFARVLSSKQNSN